MDHDTVYAAFHQATGHAADAAAYAPGRVNLIGEHTDYNDGFVLPVAVNRGVALAGRRVPGDTFTLHALDLGRSCSFVRGELHKDPEHPWADYFKGVVWALAERGLASPVVEATVAGDLPQGAGLSSSAAYEVAATMLLQSLAGGAWALSREDVAKVAREAENGFVGVACGIMDQMAAVFGEKDRAVLLDCRSLVRAAVTLPVGLKIVVINTGVRHDLASSEYNQRRAECEEGVRLLSGALPNIRALRDLSPETLAPFLPALPPVVAKRCWHVVTENARVGQSIKAMAASDLPQLKKLLAHSHFSLRDDYQVSCPELDVLVELALPIPICHGSRMTGGGFGGCTVNLVEAASVGAFADAMAADYQRRTGRAAEVHVFDPSDGARTL